MSQRHVHLLIPSPSRPKNNHPWIYFREGDTWDSVKKAYWWDVVNWLRWYNGYPLAYTYVSDEEFRETLDKIIREKPYLLGRRLS
jgi:hypothetical protein